jgi:hypothetical protein
MEANDFGTVLGSDVTTSRSEDCTESSTVDIYTLHFNFCKNQFQTVTHLLWGRLWEERGLEMWETLNLLHTSLPCHTDRTQTRSLTGPPLILRASVWLNCHGSATCKGHAGNFTCQSTSPFNLSETWCERSLWTPTHSLMWNYNV